MKTTFVYQVFYGFNYCMEFTNLEKAIKTVKQIVKDNPVCKGGYSIRLDDSIIWVY